MVDTTPPDAALQANARERLRRIARRFGPWAPLLVLVLLCVLIGFVNPNFVDPRNIGRIANSAAIPLVLALGATFIIILGSIDLSVEGVMAVGAVVVSLVVVNNFNDADFGLLSIPLVIVVGAAMGFLNGFLHVWLRIPSFMVTLGMGFAGVGLATVLLGGITVRVLDPTIRALALERFLTLPLAVWVALAVFAIAFVVERYTRLGRYMYAIGGGEDLAALSGIPVKRFRVIIFTVAGAFYGIGGLMAAAQLGQGNALIGQGRLFTTITAVVVGGTALTGGEGGVVRTLVGVLIVVVLSNGMVLMGVPTFVQQGVQGILIVVAVAFAFDRSRLPFIK